MQSLTCHKERPDPGHRVLAIRELPAHHSDPFDRLLLAQARIEGAQLVTADGQLSRYADQVELLW